MSENSAQPSTETLQAVTNPQPAATQTDTGAAAGSSVINGGTAPTPEGQTQQTQQTAGSQTAPEKYEFKLPDGMKSDDPIVSSVAALAKDLALSQEAAQKLFDARTAESARLAEAVSKGAQEWARQTVADKEIGGERLDENISIARRGAEQFATPELRKLLDETNLGNHPEIVRHFLRLGRALKSDKVVQGGKPPPDAAMSPEKILFPNMN